MLNEGVYLAQARGMAGFVHAKLTVKDNKIVGVDLDLTTETPENKPKVEQQLKKEILTRQSADIDAVSGATFTSNGVKEAVQQTLKQAEK